MIDLSRGSAVGCYALRRKQLINDVGQNTLGNEIGPGRDYPARYPRSCEAAQSGRRLNDSRLLSKVLHLPPAKAPASVTHCTCSFCSKRGALHAYCTPDQFKLTTARDRVSTYQWNSYAVRHHHCAICGCPT